MYFLTFSSDFRGTHDQKHHLHESPSTMTIPLIVLAILAVFGGLLGLPEFTGIHHGLSYFFDKSSDLNGLNRVFEGDFHTTEYILMAVATGLAIASILYAKKIYFDQKTIPGEEKGIKKLFAGKYYLDEIYNKIIIKPGLLKGTVLQNFVEEKVIDPAVNLFASASLKASANIKKIQTGNTGFYIFGIVAGVVLILFANYLIWFR
jgi:NADH-quinone oxidoreductase subunit L